MPAAQVDLNIKSSWDDLKITLSIFTNQHFPQASTPVIVVGHEIGAVKGAGLPKFATAFAGQGGNLVVSRELQDSKDVIAWVLSRPERFDRQRIVACGSSFGGMHVTAVIAQDHRLRAGIAQCPCVDGTASSLMLPIFYSLRLGLKAMADVIRSLFGAEPIYVNLTGDDAPSAPLSLMRGPEAVNGFKNIQPVDGTILSNTITARSVL